MTMEGSFGLLADLGLASGERALNQKPVALVVSLQNQNFTDRWFGSQRVRNGGLTEILATGGRWGLVAGHPVMEPQLSLAS